MHSARPLPDERGATIAEVPQDLDSIRDYYCSPRRVGGSVRSIYEIWEDGGAFNDSITPSAYVPEYRAHIVSKIVDLTMPGAHVFSIGCGNGFVEGDLVAAGRRVSAIDCNEEAVELARKKGVVASAADFYALESSDVLDYDLVYGDGLLGHLFDKRDGLDPAIGKLASLEFKAGAVVVFSNDSPRDPRLEFAPHETVSGFWFISKDHLCRRLQSFGFVMVEAYYFPYCRPISGRRDRTVCIARVA